MLDPVNTARLITDRDSLARQNRVIRWLLANHCDPELAHILASADACHRLDDLLRFIDWAIDRQLLMPVPPPINRDGDPIPF